MIFGASLRELLACIFMLGGAVFFIGSAIGMLRLPDFYSRIHASGNSETLGCILSFIGLMILEGPTLTAAKVACVFIFVILANPIGSHILSKAAYMTGHPVWTLDTAYDDEAVTALNQEHILSEPLGNLSEKPEKGEGTVKIYSGGNVDASISTVIDIADAPKKPQEKRHSHSKKHGHGNRNNKEGK